MYNNFAAPTPACTTCYLTTDYLGSVRMVTDANANVVARHDYLPFGQEILAGQAGRGSQWGVTNNINQKFTGQIRDQETGLDYFGARYFSGVQGRFNSPDDPFADQNPSDPQSWNLYSYVRNNPLNAIDPSGNDCITTSDKSDTRVTVTVASGSCEGSKGVYIPGTVDTSSLTYNGSSIGYSYTPNDSNNLAGSGTVALGPSQGGSGSDWGPGSSNMIGAAQIGRTASIGNALGAGLGILAGGMGAGIAYEPVSELILAFRAARLAASLKAAQQAWKQMPPEQRRVAMNWLSKIKPGSPSPGPLPAGADIEALKAYREVAIQVIRSGKDIVGTQQLRVQAINKAIGN